MIFFTYNLPPPTNIKNMFGNWLNGVDTRTKSRIRIGVSALVWSIWNCRNDFIFNNKMGTISCRLFAWRFIGSIFGPTYFRWISGSLWLLVATNCWWLHMTSISRLLGRNILEELRWIIRCRYSFFFDWYMSQPWLIHDCKPLNFVWLWDLAIKRLRASIDAEAGESPILKKKGKALAPTTSDGRGAAKSDILFSMICFFHLPQDSLYA